MNKFVKRLITTTVALLGLVTFATTTASAKSTTSTKSTAKATAVINKTTYKAVYKIAKAHLGARYVYGATGPSAFDCSGFTSYVYNHGADFTLPRTAQAQYNANKHVTYAHIKKGDLVFFGTSKWAISHVGLYVGKGQMIDAQNRGVVKEAVHAPWWHAVGYARVTTTLD